MERIVVLLSAVLALLLQFRALVEVFAKRPTNAVSVVRTAAETLRCRHGEGSCSVSWLGTRSSPSREVENRPNRRPAGPVGAISLVDLGCVFHNSFGIVIGVVEGIS